MAKKEVGRPKESPKDLPKDWQNKILDEYRQGKGDINVKELIHQWRGSFSNDLWDRWLLEEKEFSETIAHGRRISEIWWTEMGRINLIEDTKSGQRFNDRLWNINMQNRFSWSVKQKSDENVTQKIIIEEEIIGGKEDKD